jgi:hypothetical protein
LRLVRRRAWLFAPFFLLGLILAFLFGSAAGSSTAVASMQLETIVHELFVGGDRGLRIFEAQAMTGDEGFRQKVRDATGDPDFNFARYSIALAPISVADGVSRGILTVSIADEERGEAERLRNAFVEVFTEEYREPDGLFRTRFIGKKRDVAETAESQFRNKYQELERLAAAKGVTNLEQLARGRARTSPLDEMNVQMAQIARELAAVEGALSAINGGASGGAAAAIASSTLGQPVAAADAVAALTGKRAALEETQRVLNERFLQLSDGSLDPEVLVLLDEVRALATLKDESYVRLANATVAVASAESTIATSYSFSGGVARSTMGQVAVALAVTIVFGLIAIYALEWLAQIRAGAED